MFKADDPVRQAKSVRFLQGREDGWQDTLIASQCPPGAILGPQNEPFSWMYDRGYESSFQPMPCPCDGSCKHGKQYGEAPDERHS